MESDVTKEKEEIIIVCVGLFDRHTTDSKLTECHKCGKPVWIAPHNYHERACCLGCIPKTGERRFGIKILDLLRAKREILEERMRHGKKESS